MTTPDDSEELEDQASAYVEIQRDQLSADALRGLAEEFVSRAGTDYGSQERSFESKVQDVLRQVDRGEVRIVFDPGTESANLITAHELQKHIAQ